MFPIDGYFGMTDEGGIVVAKDLPRLRLYNTGSTTLNINVRDGGDLNAVVLATISVDSKFFFSICIFFKTMQLYAL